MRTRLSRTYLADQQNGRVAHRPHNKHSTDHNRRSYVVVCSTLCCRDTHISDQWAVQPSPSSIGLEPIESSLSAHLRARMPSSLNLDRTRADRTWKLLDVKAWHMGSLPMALEPTMRRRSLADRQRSTARNRFRPWQLHMLHSPQHMQLGTSRMRLVLHCQR